MSSPEQGGKPPGKLSRRKFLSYCGTAVLVTASYKVISVFSEEVAGQDDTTGKCWGCRFKCETSCVKGGSAPCAVVRGLYD